jgi:hypothetical protein
MKRKRQLGLLVWFMAGLSAAFAVFSLFGTPVVIDVIRGQPLFPADHPSASSGQATAELFVSLPAYAFGLLGLPIAFGLAGRFRWVHSLIRIYVLGLTLTFVAETIFTWPNITNLWTAWETRTMFFGTAAILELSKLTWPVALWLASFVLQREESIQQAGPRDGVPAAHDP